MSMLANFQITENALKELNIAKYSVSVISCFCKIDALKIFEQAIDNSGIVKRIVVRFRKSDICSGATDLELYEYCKKNGWKLYIRLDLHAKAFIFDEKTCILGSSNLTKSGMNLISSGNYELATYSDMNSEDNSKINKLFESSILVDDGLYEAMKDDISNIDNVSSKANGWSNGIMKRLIQNIEVLFPSELPNTFSPFDKEANMEFIDESESGNDVQLREAFESSKIFFWLYSVLNESENHEIYFGELTAKLHNIIYQEPKPYRREVKEYLANILNWCEELKIDCVVIDRPNYSQRLRLVK